MQPPTKDILCDTCRQNVAVRHFYDSEHPSGLIERHLCVSCPYPMTNWQQVELTRYLLLNGKCEECGRPPSSFVGIPGPERFLLCGDCLERRFGATHT